jgi:hypothetical protein
MNYWFKYTLDWMRVYNSPFKPIIPKLYIGEIAIGTPYFLPRVFDKNGKVKRKKIGFDFVGLGWKTKYDSYRHEWNPVWSFVFFKWQIALIFAPKHDMHYWECWLNYTRETKGTTKERLEQARKEFPCVWTSTKDGVKIETNYWDLILKDKYYDYSKTISSTED